MENRQRSEAFEARRLQRLKRIAKQDSTCSPSRNLDVGMEVAKTAGMLIKSAIVPPRAVGWTPFRGLSFHSDCRQRVAGQLAWFFYLHLIRGVRDAAVGASCLSAPSARRKHACYTCYGSMVPVAVPP